MTRTRTGPGECSLVGLTRSPLGRAGNSETEGRGPWEFCLHMCLGPSLHSHQTLRRRWEKPGRAGSSLLGLALSLTVCVALGKSVPSLAGPQFPHL